MIGGLAMAAETLKDCLLNVTRHLKKKTTFIQTDAGSQFVRKEWVSVCALNNIKDRSCPVDHQEMNGQVERMIGILATKMRSLLGTMEVPKKYWLLALVTAA
ncbi:MAG: transposase family protein, partial [Aestuariibacter sp.]|nr:transposase family protein [Aestuariibacter sp.]